MSQTSLVSRPSFWSRHPQHAMPPMLSTAEKDDLVATESRIEILSIRDIEHRQYGPTWILTVDVNGFARSLFMSKNSVRDEFISDAAAHIHQTGESVPVILISFTTALGYDAYGFSPPHDENMYGELPETISAE